MEATGQPHQEHGPWVVFSTDVDDTTLPAVEEALSTLVKRSGQRNGRVVILPAVCPNPVDRGRRYAQQLLLLGAGLVEVLHVETRLHANDEHAVALVTQATGILLIGDQPDQLTSLLEGTALLQVIRRRHSEGCVVAATSAAAALLTRPADIPL